MIVQRGISFWAILKIMRIKAIIDFNKILRQIYLMIISKLYHFCFQTLKLSFSENMTKQENVLKKGK